MCSMLFFENNATLFCNSNLSVSARKEVGHEWSTTPLIGTPVYGLLFPRIASFLMMDNLAYWNHARIGGRHSSGTSFKPGAPLHSTCLGSPELYRRSEGVGWRVKTFTLSQLTFTDSRWNAAEQTRTKLNPQRRHRRVLDATGASFILLYLFIKDNFRKTYYLGTTAGIADSPFT